MFAALAILALSIEAAFGYPDALYRRIGHPVTWIGALIAWADRTWNVAGRSALAGRLAGIALVVLLVGVAAGTGLLVTHAAQAILPAFAAMMAVAILATSLIAQRSLHDHVAAVAHGLETEGLAGGRRAVAMIVGRDPESLDEAGVSRAAIESLAENFCDGIVAPTFWLALAGLPGALVYKAINTADSMVGHRTPRHIWFGWASARTDDAINLPASRFSALLIAGAAATLPDADPARAVSSVLRDAHRHRSPNAGWPEAAMAGALGLRLAGPRVYGGTPVDDHWMGDGRAEATAADIRRALLVYRRACLLQGLVYALLAAATWAATGVLTA